MNSINGNGTAGLSHSAFMEWLRSFMGEKGDIEIECGIDAHAAIWTLAAGEVGIRIDPKDAETIRTPWGPFRLSIAKDHPPGSAYVSNNVARILTSIQNLKLIIA